MRSEKLDGEDESLPTGKGPRPCCNPLSIEGFNPKPPPPPAIKIGSGSPFAFNYNRCYIEFVYNNEKEINGKLKTFLYKYYYNILI